MSAASPVPSISTGRVTQSSAARERASGVNQPSRKTAREVVVFEDVGLQKIEPVIRYASDEPKE